MLKIATFGSCLSRYTANHYVKLFGGKVVSSVYHNRSDAFLHRFVECDWKVGTYDFIAEKLISCGEYTPDSLPENILKNQFSETIGKHRLNSGIPFLDSIMSNSIDLLIMDNYMDLSAKLISAIDFEGIFLRLNDVDITTAEIEILDYLTPVESMRNMIKIINFFRFYSPGTRIIFLNFPYNTYEGYPDRVARAKEYESLFKYRDIDIVPALDVPIIYQTKDKQHFKNAQYCAYAGIVYSLFHRR